MEPLRILLAVHQFFPQFRAGTETLTRRTAEELSRRGHRVWILAAGPHDPAQPPLRRELWEGLELIRFNPPPDPHPLAGGLASSVRHPATERRFRQLLEELQPDLLHWFHLRRHSLSLVDAAVAAGVPMVASLTDYWFGCPTGQLQFPEQRPCAGPEGDGSNCLRHLGDKLIPGLGVLPTPLWRLLMAVGGRLPFGPLRALRGRPDAMALALSCCEHVLVPTALMKRTFAQLGFDTQRFVTCPYGLDLTGLATLPPRQTWPGPKQRPLRIGFIGNLTRPKGAHVLLEALARLGPGFEVEALLYGNPEDDPAYAADLLRQAADVPQVRWTGLFASSEVFAVLAQLDLLVVPSLWRENAPLILLQALASGLPLLVSDVEGMADQVQVGRNAELFPAGESQALAERLLRFQQQPQRLARLVNQGGQPRTIAAYGDQLEQLYARLQRR